jgi:hemin uptake protein HemP
VNRYHLDWQLEMSVENTPTAATEQSTSTEKLMQGKNELVIFHSEQRYILRITRNGKLILTK